MLDEIGAGEEAAHAVAEDHIGQAGILLAHEIMELVDVGDHIIPAVFLGKKALIRGGLDGLAVAEVIVAHGDEAVLREEGHEITVAVHVLGDAVLDLDNTPGRSVREAFQTADGILAGAGREAEFFKNGHDMRLLSVWLILPKGRTERCGLCDKRDQPTISLVSLAMTSSSFVGMTKTLTLESGVEIMTSSPRLELAASSMVTPR